MSSVVHASAKSCDGSPMVSHVYGCQLSTRGHRQERPGALQVAVCANAIRTLSPSEGFNLIHIRL